MSAAKNEFFRGARSAAPLSIGIIPFALVFGLAVREAGLTGAQASFFSLSMLAGTAQLAAIQLYAAKASAVVIILTAMIVNLRYSMYSLSLYSILKEKSFTERLFAAFFVSDQSYAITMADAESSPGNPFLPAFFFGASLMTFLVWVCGIFFGYSLEKLIPAALSLDFAIPLVFIYLLIPQLKGRDRQISALTGAVASVILVPRLPLQTGLLAAILIGIGAGMAAGASIKKNDPARGTNP